MGERDTNLSQKNFPGLYYMGIKFEFTTYDRGGVISKTSYPAAAAAAAVAAAAAADNYQKLYASPLTGDA